MFLSKHTYLFSVLVVSTIPIFIISLLKGATAFGRRDFISSKP